MLEAIQKLLILQDRDRKIATLSEELARVIPQRTAATGNLASAKQALENATHRAHQLESDRKKLELDVEAKKGLIERYSNQQFETRKNEEYRALAHEIEMCKEGISKLEDQELEIMEQIDRAQAAIVAAQRTVAELTADTAKQVLDLDQRGANLERDLAGLQANRSELAAAVEPTTLARYERLLKSKGTNIVVGVQRGACGGCHMRVTAQLLVDCRAQQVVVTCPNCGRILYFDSGMDTTHDD
jgi:predicted  nucleic acid-binding Zn-ribbon protein